MSKTDNQDPDVLADAHTGYGRARLWLGISGVGFWVVVASAALIVGLPQRLGMGVSVASGDAPGAAAALSLIHI